MLRSISKKAARHSRDLSNVGAFLATRLLAIGLYAVSLPIFINRTSEAAYGVIAIGFSFISLSMLLDVAVGYVVAQGVGRRLARTGKRHLKLFNTLFWIYFLGAFALAMLLVLVFMNVGLPDDERNLFIWIGLLLPALAISGIVAAVFQANNSLVYLNSSRFIFEAGKAAALIISALLFAEPDAVGPLLFVIVLLRALLDLWQLRVRMGYRVYPTNFIEMLRYRPLLMMGLPSLWTVLLSLLVNIGDKLLIAKLFSKADVAHYSLAFDVNTKAYLILGAINSAMYAVMIRNHAMKRSSSTQIWIGLVTVVIIGLIYYLPLALFSKQILSVWVSPEFGAAASHLVPVFALASLAYLCGNVFEISLLAKGLSVKVFQIYCVAVFMYFITLLLLINRIGLSAFAWAYVIMNMAMFIGTSLSYRIYTAKYKS
jgi:O-antigen/teichoic acid export membrane protein